MLPMQQYDARVARSNTFTLGDFEIQPTFEESTGYDTNPLGDNGRGSSLLDTRARVQIGSDWTRDVVGADFSVDNASYLDRPSASQTNWQTAIGGGLDVAGSRLSLGYTHFALNLDSQELGVVGVTTPIPYSDDDVRVDGNLVFGRVRVIPQLDVQSYSFGQVSNLSPVGFSDLDRTLVAETLTGLFELSRGRSIVVLIRDTAAGYNNNVPGINNDYNDLVGFVGVDLQADALFRLRALVGGENRTFTSPTPSLLTPALQIEVTYAPTRLTSVITTFTRRLEDAASVQTGSQTLTEGRIEIDHALRRNIALSAFADVGSSVYPTALAGGSPTSQMVENFGVNASWDLNRHVRLTLAYSYFLNSFSQSGLTVSNGASSTTNVATLGLTLSQ